MQFVDIAAPFTTVVAMYLFMVTFKHMRKGKEVKSMFSIKVLRLTSISILSLQTIAVMVIVICTKLGINHGLLVDYFANTSHTSTSNTTSEGLENSNVKEASYVYELISVFFVLLYRIVIEFMLVSRVKVIFRKAPFDSKSIEFKCNWCVFIATVLAVVQFFSCGIRAFLKVERMIFFVLMTFCYFGNLVCKLYFVRCSLVTFKSFKKLTSNSKTSKLAFNRRKAYVKRMKTCMFLYFINDVTVIIVGGVLKAFNKEKYDDSIFIVACLFFNCIDFAILLGTYNKWRSIFTFYLVKKKETKLETSNTKKGLATSAIKTTKITESSRIKVKKLPVI